MRNILKTMYEKWNDRRRARAMNVLDDLKVRYHTFRILLGNNEISLNLLRSVDQSLRSPAPSRTDLAEEVEELLEVTYELVDGLNRLTGNRYGGLYEKHRHLSESVHAALGGIVSQPPHALRCIALDDLNLDCRGLVGGKAATLAFLKVSGFPVPDGFAVTAEACGEILSENDLSAYIRKRLQRLQSTGVHDTELQTEADYIHGRIMEAPLPAPLEAELRAAYERLGGNGVGKGNAPVPVSVRSSAFVEDRPEHSFAGQFKSVLNVTSFEGLKAALKEVVASNYSARSITYRLQAGLPLGSHDMAVLCQRMVPARAAGGLFTVDPAAPESGRMLMSAVPGLGILAVSGSAPADLYRPLRQAPDREPMDAWARIAHKTHRAVAVATADGGVREEELPGDERNATVISREEALGLVRYGRMIESLLGRPQDIEWAVSPQGESFILQSRDIRLSGRDRQAADVARGKVLLKGGVSASPGRCVGRAKIIRSMQDMQAWRTSGAQPHPSILVLHQSLVEAAGWLPEFEGVVVDLGNPADHLSCVARELSRPMLTGTGSATEALRDGEWVILDADSGVVVQAPEEVWSEAAEAEAIRKKRADAEDRATKPRGAAPPELARLREIIEPLNLTDAYGPTFSIHECRSLHDIIRYAHEMAVLAMFDVADDVLEEAEVLLHRLDEGMPFHFLVIDLGGGITPDRKGFKIRLGDILSAPLLALWKGMSTPGLRWSEPPPVPGISSLFSKTMLDARSARPVGNQNYALITRDYLNLNARVDYHFSMVDAVCGANPRENYIRFRFKGGGTSAVQRERRARFVAQVFEEHHFTTDQQGDLVNASISETKAEEIEARLVMIGRLLGFSRLLDAAMSDDSVPRKVARAFLDGDYALRSMKEEFAGS